jgi:hypothetical protein
MSRGGVQVEGLFRPNIRQTTLSPRRPSQHTPAQLRGVGLQDSYQEGLDQLKTIHPGGLPTPPQRHEQHNQSARLRAK